MPNQRAKNRRILALWLDQEFRAALDAARSRKHMDRSTFIRYAIGEELKRQGMVFEEKAIYAPDRAGKSRKSAKCPPADTNPA